MQVPQCPGNPHTSGSGPRTNRGLSIRMTARSCTPSGGEHRVSRAGTRPGRVSRTASTESRWRSHRIRSSETAAMMWIDLVSGSGTDSRQAVPAGTPSAHSPIRGARWLKRSPSSDASAVQSLCLDTNRECPGLSFGESSPLLRGFSGFRRLRPSCECLCETVSGVRLDTIRVRTAELYSVDDPKAGHPGAPTCRCRRRAAADRRGVGSCAIDD
jgi:hypothetical protein